MKSNISHATSVCLLVLSTLMSLYTVFQMNAVRRGTVTWRPQPWQDGDGGGGEPLSDSDSEEEDFPDDSTTPLGDYITHGETDFSSFLVSLLLLCLLSKRLTPPPGRLACVSAGLKQLLDAQQLCDVTLLVEGKKFMCHRFEFADE